MRSLTIAIIAGLVWASGPAKAAQAVTAPPCNSPAVTTQVVQQLRRWFISNLVGSFTGAPRATFDAAMWPGKPVGCLLPGDCPGLNNPLSCSALAVSEYIDPNGATYRSGDFEIEFFIAPQPDGQPRITLDDQVMLSGAAVPWTVALMKEEEKREENPLQPEAIATPCNGARQYKCVQQPTTTNAKPLSAPAAEVLTSPAVSSREEAPAAPQPALDDVTAAVKSINPDAALKIQSYCTKAAAGSTNLKSCEQREMDAWQRVVLKREFPEDDPALDRRCSEPPFPADSFVAYETCMKYERNIQ
jgi:hypothetical protein